MKQSWSNWHDRCRKSSTLTLVVVTIALFVDHMLLTVVTPIIPVILFDSQSYNGSGFLDKTTAVGLLFASKAFLQLIVNPFIGPLTGKIGYNIPMLFGIAIIFLSTVVFAFGKSYYVLLAARAMQGVGTSCSTVAGLGFLALKYPDDEERGSAMGYAMGGIALGVLAGPPFGAVLHELINVSAPFLILAGLILFDGVLQLVIYDPSANTGVIKDPTSILTLVRDPYILIAAASVTFGNLGIAILEPILPLRMMKTMNSEKWVLGVVFAPCSLGYLLGTKFFASLTYKIGRWLGTMLGLVGSAVSMACIPFAQNPYHLIAPLAVLGLSVGLIDCAIMPHLGYLVDTRHTPSYGSVYAIGNIALGSCFCAGPALSGVIESLIGFDGLMFTTAGVTLAFAPLLFFLRKVPSKITKTLGEDTM